MASGYQTATLTNTASGTFGGQHPAAKDAKAVTELRLSVHVERQRNARNEHLLTEEHTRPSIPCGSERDTQKRTKVLGGAPLGMFQFLPKP
ncbi:hypothetical protein BaRGS_00001081 [Batillaria attramentaria]|uniref:Uncharacterized protein n=1 Tax=Batillaria attramentaria TaxID=370345 RepID=A0ABD0M661_9CAEN